MGMWPRPELIITSFPLAQDLVQGCTHDPLWASKIQNLVQIVGNTRSNFFFLHLNPGRFRPAAGVLPCEGIEIKASTEWEESGNRIKIQKDIVWC